MFQIVYVTDRVVVSRVSNEADDEGKYEVVVDRYVNTSLRG
tara:strand:+ start:404 stop:526 length:123 start_codon:yes stop_codon:yes gene_type:complete